MKSLHSTSKPPYERRQQQRVRCYIVKRRERLWGNEAILRQLLEWEVPPIGVRAWGRQEVCDQYIIGLDEVLDHTTMKSPSRSRIKSS